jgi:hypothetical protein
VAGGSWGDKVESGWGGADALKMPSWAAGDKLNDSTCGAAGPNSNGGGANTRAGTIPARATLEK